MVSLETRKVAKYIDDLYDQLNTLGDYLHPLSANVGKRARRQFGRASNFASETAHDTEDAVKSILSPR